MAIKYTFVGHATHILDISGTKVLIDPFFSSNPTTDVSADDVEADFIIVSHGHFDHTYDIGAIAMNTGAKVFCCETTKEWLVKKGVNEDQIEA